MVRPIVLREDIPAHILCHFVNGHCFSWANRATHIVSMLHALLVVPIAFRSLDSPKLDQDRAFGWDDEVAPLYAISSGYVYRDFLVATTLLPY